MFAEPGGGRCRPLPAAASEAAGAAEREAEAGWALELMNCFSVLPSPAALAGAGVAGATVARRAPGRPTPLLRTSTWESSAKREGIDVKRACWGLRGAECVVEARAVHSGASAVVVGASASCTLRCATSGRFEAEPGAPQACARVADAMQHGVGFVRVPGFNG